MQLGTPYLQGSQTPTHKSCPNYPKTLGPDATKFAAKAGLILDPWQSGFLRDAMGVVGSKWAAPDVGLVVPRQNGKGAVLEALVLTHLFLLDTKLILWTSHEFKTTREAFLRVKSLVEGSPHLMKHVKLIRTGNGEEAVELVDGSRLRFIARSKSSGRGFSADLVILDEAYDLTDLQLSAILPTVSARPNPQVWYTSSAPMLTSAVLRRLCKRGRKGSAGLAYHEYCASASDEVTTHAAWATANPGLGIRLTIDTLQRMLDAMDPEDFQREVMGVWLEDAFDSVIDLAIWGKLALEEAEPGEPLALAVDVTPDRRYAAIGAASLQADGTQLVEIIDEGQGTKWLAPRLIELTYTHKPVVIVIDSRSPAASLMPDLFEVAGFTVFDEEPDWEEGEIIVQTNSTDLANACGAFYDAVTDSQTIRHLDDPALRSALEGAAQRPLGDSWAWSRKQSAVNIAPLVAVTLAFHGLRLYGGVDDDDGPLVFFR